MDSSEIDDALDQEYSELTDFENSGSEYIPQSESDDSELGLNGYESSVNYNDELFENVADGTISNESDNEQDAQVDQQSQTTDVASTSLQQNITSQIPSQPSTTEHWGDIQVSNVQFPFTGPSGFQYDVNKSDPIAIFNQFLTDEIIELIVNETNRYAHQYLASVQMKPRSMMKKWVDCTAKEIKTLFGIVMIMGLCPVPKLRLFWSNKQLYKNDVIKKHMARDRFEILLKCLHFENNETVHTDEPRLSKLKKLIEMVNDRFKEVYVPGKYIVVDETMVPWRGRLIFRQYNPQKAHRYGVKIYKLCSEDGYTYKVKIYAGKEDVTRNVGHAQKVVLHLVHDLLNQGRTLFMDNFYNSVTLAECLLTRQTYVCGTLRSDRRGNPKVVTKKKLKKGEVYGQENEKGVKVLKWVDKRPVLMITSRPEDSDCLVPSGKLNRKKEEISKPSSVLAYNNVKKGVDISDQLSSYYSPLRKTIRWYKKVAFELILGTCVVNAFVIFNSERQKRQKWEMLKFREAIIDELLKDEPSQGTTTISPRSTPKTPHILKNFAGKYDSYCFLT